MLLTERKGVHTTIQLQGLLQAAGPCRWASDYSFRSFSAKVCLLRSSHNQVVYSHTSCLHEDSMRIPEPLTHSKFNPLCGSCIFPRTKFGYTQ
jgi:hypothetical protein